MTGELDVPIPPDLLAAAEEWLGYYAALNATEGAIHADIVRAELARLRAIEAAAVAHVEAETGSWFYRGLDENGERTLDALRTAVEAEVPDVA